MPLLRILGVAFGLAVVVGTTIGAGILRAPGPVLAYAGSGPVALLYWAAGGAFALLAASALADLATSVPKSGGLYVFARRALGPGFGFAIGCADWFANSTAVAYGAVAFAEFLGRLVPPMAGRVMPIGMAVIVTFAGLQMLGLRVSSRLQETISFVKALAFFALIGGLLVAAVPASSDVAIAARPVPSIVALVLAMQLVFSAYDGWQSASYFAGEDRDPSRNLPRALIGGMLTVIAVYLLVNVALLRVLPAGTIASSILPAADAARVLAGERGATIITALSVLSVMSLVNAVLLCSPRIAYAMSVDGLLPARLSFVDSRGTPAVALAASTVLSLVMLASGGFETMVTIGGSFAIISYAGAFLALIVLRAREPELPRPYRSWGHPYTTALVLAVSLAMLGGTIAGAPRESLIAAAALAATYPVYRMAGRRRS
jgi:APA family basic amino acid/polyamine antiporter